MSEKVKENKMQERKIVDFMGHRKTAAVVSIALLVGSIFSLIFNGLNYGLDFTGGTLVEVGYSQPESLEKIRSTITDAGYSNAVVVQFGSETDILIRLPLGYSDELGMELVAALQKEFVGNITLRRIEFVGPQVGDELKEQGGMAMLMALGLVMLYVALRFQLKFSIGAVGALIHDVIITLGIFSVLQIDFDLTVLAAVLAVIGYSLNDTIVVSDRIRENFRKIRKSDPVYIINVSLTETLGRTLVTSLTTLLVLTALFVFGGELIHGFSIALIIGVVVGTYSSIYVAANILLLTGVSKEDLIIPVKEGGEIDDMP